MQLPEAAGPSGHDPDDEAIIFDKVQEEAIFTCKFPGCTRQYASTDGVRKHCRKSHPDWLREVDLDKANHGCRWAAYCTREAITESNDPRTTPIGSKRAREIMAQGGALPPMVGVAGGLVDVMKASVASSFAGAESSSSRPASFASEEPPKPEPKPEPPKVPKHAPHQLAMDGKSALVPLQPYPTDAERRENVMPPEMIALPGELSSPLPVNVSALTPNAQARQRLGEIADSESVCLQGGGAASFPTSLLVAEPQALQPCGANALCGANSFFVQWAMPPIKRGMSLADTREPAAQQAMTTHHSEHEDASVSHDSPSFLESFLA